MKQKKCKQQFHVFTKKNLVLRRMLLVTNKKKKNFPLPGLFPAQSQA